MTDLSGVPEVLRLIAKDADDTAEIAFHALVLALVPVWLCIFGAPWWAYFLCAYGAGYVTLFAWPGVWRTWLWLFRRTRTGALWAVAALTWLALVYNFWS